MNRFFLAAGQVLLLSVGLFAASLSISLEGKIVNSSFQNEPGVMVILSFESQDFVNISGDTAYTGADGVFKKTVSYNGALSADSGLYFYLKCKKDGFIQTTQFTYFKAQDTIDLGTLHIKDGVYRNIPITATVVDSATNSAVRNAKVICYSFNSASTLTGDQFYFSPFDTFTTDASGAISGTLHSLPMDYSSLRYSVQLPGFIVKQGNKSLGTANTLALGTIAINKNNTGIRTSEAVSYRPVNALNGDVAIYSLKGRRLYKEKAIHVSQPKSHGIAGSMPLIIKQGNGKSTVVKRVVNMNGH